MLTDIQCLTLPDKMQLYSILLDAIPSSILVLDGSLRIVSVNRNFLEKSQRLMKDTISRRLEEVFPAVILEHTSIKKQVYDCFEKKRVVRGHRMTYRAPGIPIRTYYYSILPIGADESVRLVVLLMEDVTEQVRLSEEVRRMERHLASVVESAQDIVLSTDLSGRILTWNSAAEKLSGFKFNEVKGHCWSEFCSQVANITGFLEQICFGSDVHTAEWELITKENQMIPVSWVVSPMMDDYRKVVGFVAVGRDLTEQRKLEYQLRQSQKIAALGVMAGGIAHEIRNPLAICSSAAQFLQEESLPTHFARECADKIQVSIEKISSIIENLLRFSRPTTASEMVSVDLVKVVQEALTLIASHAKVQNICVNSQFPKQLVLVSGVASLLQQVFLNLCLNAVNAMPNGGTLTVSFFLYSDCVEVQVEDTGVGINPKDFDKIFDPFHTTSPIGKGTGLGLTICYSIIKQHFGHILVESYLNQGSKFTVKLPLQQKDS
ncbi:PAS domain-containing sensor histidine kinase [Spartinivicinus poritis]|uniref:histidine kinase n=1 Tax=Spartinivicinus poritis TaxID=2994640 RepID=A0ABT5U543_9GAMM|nr:PAS domain-containing sensor histidine kinase [Spartinivicinus sp. A2-2]MDE1461468.1 ATP-binding protein [Spartinivicinus sp. A2-2]